MKSLRSVKSCLIVDKFEIVDEPSESVFKVSKCPPANNVSIFISGFQKSLKVQLECLRKYKKSISANIEAILIPPKPEMSR